MDQDMGKDSTSNERINIIYGFSTCSDKKYFELFDGSNYAIAQAIHKYHSLLLKGFSANGVSIKALSGLPINRTVTKKILIHVRDEIEGNIKYHYYTTLNLPFIRQIMIMMAAFINVIFAKNKYDCILTDALNKANTIGLSIAAKLRRIPVVMIVTDLPEYMNGGIVKTINNRLFAFADSFILLTEQMNEKVNMRNKPYVVIEGQTDSNVVPATVNEKIETKTGKKVIIYAGALSKIYGLDILVNGFLKADIPNSELQIFGDGDYRGEIENVATSQPNVKYLGVRPNNEVVWVEKTAALLVNPRPSLPEYTKYSFPSKNMEYMMSGTPTMTTRLPGMPSEYNDYVTLIEDETADGVSEALKIFFDLPFNVRQSKGETAYYFVKKNKTNVIQAEKITRFIEEHFCDWTRAKN